MTLEEEKEKLQLINDDMYCNKYEMMCKDVPFEIIGFKDTFGFSNYECDLNCDDCFKMELL